MDNRVVSVISSKKRRKKKKPPRPESLPKLPEVPVGVTPSVPVSDQNGDNQNCSTTHTIPQLTVTPPEDDGSLLAEEINAPPEVNILNQCPSSSSLKRKKRRKKPSVLPTVKDEVRPTVGYTPRSLCKSVSVQPTVNELEEVSEEAETQCEGSSSNQIASRPSGSHRRFGHPVPELPEEDNCSEQVLLYSSDSAYGSVESTTSTSPVSHSLTKIHLEDVIPQESDSVSDSCTTSSVASSLPTELNHSADYDHPVEELTLREINIQEVAAVSLDTNDLILENCNLESSHLAQSEVRPLNSTSHSEPDGCENNIGFDVKDCEQAETGNLQNQLETVVNYLLCNQDTGGSGQCKTSVTEDSGANQSHASVVITGCTVDSVLEKSGKDFDTSVRSETDSINVLVTDKMPEVTSIQKNKAQEQKKSELPATQSCQSDASPEDKKEVANVTKPDEEKKSKAQLKAERKAAFEAQKGAQIAAHKAQKAQMSKAERRAIQEAQRATKEPPPGTVGDPNRPGSTPAPIKTASSVPPAESKSQAHIKITDPPFKKQAAKVSHEKELSPQQKLHLFSHLPQFKWDSSITSKLGLSGKSLHPAIIQVGVRMANGYISGSDARCVATLSAFCEVIKDYTTPPQKELSRDLDAKVKSCEEFLNKCRPLSVSMINAIKELKRSITDIPSSMTDAEAKEKLLEEIKYFIELHVVLSKQAIADFASDKIHSGDVILIYGCSPLVKEVLCKAKEKKTNFKVIVVDARPNLDGREMVRYLVREKIECSYILINAVSYVMKEVNLVLLDCHSLQANGYVMSRVGSSQIALVAQASNVPVLVCCETYKFCDRVNLDAFVDNELGDPEDLVTSLPAHKSHLENWKEMSHLNLVNLTYDLTPGDLVTAIVTELCTLPCTSVPVVLREKQHTSKKKNEQK